MSFVVALRILVAAAAMAAPSSPPTFCAEWVEQSREGYERLTLFEDRNLVWKRQQAGNEQILAILLAEAEAAAETRGEHADALRVPVGVGILRLERRGEREDDALVLLEVLEVEAQA